MPSSDAVWHRGPLDLALVGLLVVAVSCALATLLAPAPRASTRRSP